MPEETSITIPGTKVQVPRKIALLVAVGVVILFVFLQRSGKTDTSAGGGEETQDDTSGLNSLLDELLNSDQGLEPPSEVVDVPSNKKHKNGEPSPKPTPTPDPVPDLTVPGPIVIKKKPKDYPKIPSPSPTPTPSPSEPKKQPKAPTPTPTPTPTPPAPKKQPKVPTPPAPWPTGPGH